MLKRQQSRWQDDARQHAGRWGSDVTMRGTGMDLLWRILAALSFDCFKDSSSSRWVPINQAVIISNHTEIFPQNEPSLLPCWLLGVHLPVDYLCNPHCRGKLPDGNEMNEMWNEMNPSEMSSSPSQLLWQQVSVSQNQNWSQLCRPVRVHVTQFRGREKKIKIWKPSWSPSWIQEELFTVCVIDFYFCIFSCTISATAWIHISGFTLVFLFRCPLRFLMKG